MCRPRAEPPSLRVLHLGTPEAKEVECWRRWRRWLWQLLLQLQLLPWLLPPCLLLPWLLLPCLLLPWLLLHL